MADKAKATLGDIAKLAQVTAGTVHKALNNRPGVSEEKKRKILEIADSLGYFSNRTDMTRSKTLAVLLPEPTGINKYFYQYVWQGIRASSKELSLKKMSVIEYYFDGTMEDQKLKMEEILEQQDESINSLLTIIWQESPFLEIIRQLDDNGIKVFTVSSDAPGSCRISTVMANPYQTGRLAGEYLGSIINQSGKVIVMGTRRDSQNHAQVVRGFYDQISEQCPDLQLIELYESLNNPERLFNTLEDFLSSFSNIRGIYCNNARTTVKTLKKLQEISLDHPLPFIGSEIFQETQNALNDGSLTAVIDQSPFYQGYLSIHHAYDNLILEKQLDSVCYVGPTLVLRNSLPYTSHRLIPELLVTETDDKDNE